MTKSEITPEEVLHTLKNGVQTILLSTVGDDGSPHSGATPFVFGRAQCDEEHHVFIFVSQLALHTRDLLSNGKASVMLIADEADSSQIFARTRVSYQCQAEKIAPEDACYEALLDRFQRERGKMIGLLRTLPDFVLFRLIPQRGQFVMGFGRAYQLSGEKMNQLVHARSA